MRKCIFSVALLSLVALVACHLVNLTFIVPWENLDPTGSKVAISSDGTVLWSHQQSSANPQGRDIVALNPNTGAVLMNIGALANGYQIVDLAAAYEAGREKEVWALHENGILTRCNHVIKNITAYQQAIPTSQYPVAEERVFCAMSTGLDGTKYITAGDKQGSYWFYYLYKNVNGIVTRAPENISTNVCPDANVDIWVDAVAVMWTTGMSAYEVAWFDPTTLTEVYHYPYDVIATRRDFVAFNHKIAVSNYAPMGGFIRTYDNQGDPIDTSHEANAWGLAIQYVDNTARLWWTGWSDPDGGPYGDYSAGWFQLQ